jgi:hypothetical protein
MVSHTIRHEYAKMVLTGFTPEAMEAIQKGAAIRGISVSHLFRVLVDKALEVGFTEHLGDAGVEYKPASRKRHVNRAPPPIKVTLPPAIAGRSIGSVVQVKPGRPVDFRGSRELTKSELQFMLHEAVVNTSQVSAKQERAGSGTQLRDEADVPTADIR